MENDGKKTESTGGRKDCVLELLHKARISAGKAAELLRTSCARRDDDYSRKAA